MEILKSLNGIVECGELYVLSNYGVVYRTDKNGNIIHSLKQTIINTGYCMVDLRYNGNRKSHSVHRLVAKAFIPNPENKPQVNHIDCNKKNNRFDNLEWCTNNENLQHLIENRNNENYINGRYDKRTKTINGKKVSLTKEENEKYINAICPIKEPTKRALYQRERRMRIRLAKALLAESQKQTE